MNTPVTIEDAREHVKQMAIIDGVVTWIIGVSLCVLLLVDRHKYISFYSHILFPEEIDEINVSVLKPLLLVTILCTFLILLAIKLHRAAKNNDHQSCKIWLYLTPIATFAVLFTIWLPIAFKSDEFYEFRAFIASVIYFLYSVYKMLVVLPFMTLLKNPGAFDSPGV